MDSFVGPYRILRLINRGGQGSVYLGFDKRLHRRVAIKIYHLPSARAARKQLLREAQLVASMETPKIVQVYDVIESDTHLALVMEYVPGCNLEEFLQAVRPSLGSIVTIATDIAGALAIARQKHIVHGDLKAGNVLITTSGRAKLTDFGIALRVGVQARKQLSGGSLSALSPEQYRGDAVDEQADLFALGCLLYRMLSGQHAFYRDGKFDADLLLRKPPRPLEDLVGAETELSSQLVETVTALLEKEPGKRPRHTRGVRQVLRSVGRELPMAARNSLLEEVRPCFRPESAEDLPPQVPADLGQQGRSRMLPPKGRLARVEYEFKSLRRSSQVAVVFLLLCLALLPLALVHHYRVTPVQFAEPKISFSAPIDVPREVSPDWLLSEVKSALTERLGKLLVLGAVDGGPRKILYSVNAAQHLPREPEEVFAIILRCSAEMCVINISRDNGSTHSNQQAILLPDMPLQQWQGIIRDTTLALFP